MNYGKMVNLYWILIVIVNLLLALVVYMIYKAKKDILTYKWLGNSFNNLGIAFISGGIISTLTSQYKFESYLIFIGGVVYYFIGCYCLMKIEKFEETKHFGELKKKKQ